MKAIKNNLLMIIIIILFSPIVLLSASCTKPNVTIEGQYVWHNDKPDPEFDEYILSHEMEPISLVLYKMKKYNCSEEDILREKCFKKVASQKTTKLGNFKFELYVDPNEPEIYFLTEKEVKPEELFFMGSYDNNIQIIVAEPGDINIKYYHGRTEVTGTPINEELSKFLYYDFNKPRYQFEDSISQVIDDVYQNETDILLKTQTIEKLERLKYEYSENYDERQKQEYAKYLYPFLKKNIDKKFIAFFSSSARYSLSEEQYEDLRKMDNCQLEDPKN